MYKADMTLRIHTVLSEPSLHSIGKMIAKDQLRLHESTDWSESSLGTRHFIVFTEPQIFFHWWSQGHCWLATNCLKLKVLPTVMM